MVPAAVVVRSIKDLPLRMEAGDNALLCMRARARGESPAELVREAVKLYLMLGPEVPQ